MYQLNSILGVALIIVVGYSGAKLLRTVHFPAVTAYLIVGVLIGPRLLNLVPHVILNQSDFVSNFVLGIIAFSLGANFTVKNFRAAGSSVLWISVLEAGFAWLIVTLVMIAYFLLRRMPIHPAFVLGAAASATAPAATVMVVREYQARGVVTDMLLRVVAIDDAWCLVFSALAITFATALHTGVINIGVMGTALLEIFASITFGIVCGFGLHFISRIIKHKDELLIVMLGYILLLVGLSVTLHLSSLLTCMAAGILVTNVNKNSSLFFSTLREVDPVLFLSFFVLVGASLELGIIPQIGLIGLLYIFFRVIGKFLGVTLGAKISRADPKIGNYLAWGLVPQAGVALGVALAAKTLYPVYGVLIFTTITATTVIYELVGPVCAKYGLKKAGEI